MGSTKERLTRPLRKILAQDPIGPGVLCVPPACSCPLPACLLHLQCRRAACHVPLRVPAHHGLRAGRAVALWLANLGQQWRAQAARRMPVARGDIREIIGQPVFLPLYKLYQVYGSIFKLSFGPKNFVVVSDPKIVKQVRRLRVFWDTSCGCWGQGAV